VPSSGPASMVGMTISQWENAIGLPPLPPISQRTPDEAKEKLQSQAKTRTKKSTLPATEKAKNK